MCAVFSDGHALKLSVKKGGLEEEIENARKFPNFTCFPKLVDWHSGFSSCVVEAVEPDFGDEKCAEFYGVTREQVAEVLAGACGPAAEGCSFARKPANEAELRFLAKVKDEDGPEWESMRGLLKFFQAKGPLYDIAYGNWGLAVRGSARVPVILDHDV